MSSGPQPDSYQSDDPPLVVIGQTGQDGLPGRQGMTGNIGVQGRRGIAGPAGIDGVLSTGKILALFAFIVAVFLLLAYRSEVNARAIEKNSLRNERQVYAICQVGHDNAASLSAVLDQILVSVARRTDLPPAQKAESLRIYRDAKPRVVNCGARP